MFQLVIWMMFLPTCIFRDIDRKTICLNSAGKTMIQHQGRIEAHIQRSHHHQSLTQSINSINSINQINQSTKLTKSNQPINQKNKQINPCIHSSINHCLSPFFFPHGGDPHPLNLFLGKPPRPPTLGRGWHTPDISR